MLHGWCCHVGLTCCLRLNSPQGMCHFRKVIYSLHVEYFRSKYENLSCPPDRNKLLHIELPDMSYRRSDKPLGITVYINVYKLVIFIIYARHHKYVAQAVEIEVLANNTEGKHNAALSYSNVYRKINLMWSEWKTLFNTHKPTRIGAWR